MVALGFFHTSEFCLTAIYNRKDLGWRCERCLLPPMLRPVRPLDASLLAMTHAAGPIPAPQPGCSASPTAWPSWQPAWSTRRSCAGRPSSSCVQFRRWAWRLWWLGSWCARRPWCAAQGLSCCGTGVACALLAAGKGHPGRPVAAPVCLGFFSCWGCSPLPASSWRSAHRPLLPPGHRSTQLHAPHPDRAQAAAQAHHPRHLPPPPAPGVCRWARPSSEERWPS